jgi:hypothetical protein
VAMMRGGMVFENCGLIVEKAARKINAPLGTLFSNFYERLT